MISNKTIKKKVGVGEEGEGEEEGRKQKFLGEKCQIPANTLVVLNRVHYKDFSNSKIFIRHLEFHSQLN